MNRARVLEFVRFLTVGTFSALLNTVIIVAFTEIFGLPYLVSFLLCFALVTTFGFVLNRRWSFKVGGATGKNELLRYWAITVLALTIAMIASEGMVRVGVPYYVAVFLAAGLMAPFNFIAHRRFSFGLR